MKENEPIPAVIICGLQKVRKVRFTVVKAQVFPSLTCGNDMIFIETFSFA